MKSLSLLVSILLVSLLTFSCAGAPRNTYKVLSISFQTYDTVLSSIADLYKQGHISEVQKEKIISAGNVYKESHNTVVSALLTYKSTEALSDEANYLSAMSVASLALADLIRIATPLLEGGK